MNTQDLHTLSLSLWSQVKSGTITQEEFDYQIKQLVLRSEMNSYKPQEVKSAEKIFNKELL